MRRFHLLFEVDTEPVAEGVQFSDGACSLRWLPTGIDAVRWPPPGVVFYTPTADFGWIVAEYRLRTHWLDPAPLRGAA
jgi:hypothetical protein